MSEKNNNTFTKILIVLVIASLALLAIVYVLNKVKNSDGVIMGEQTKERSKNEFNTMGKTVLNLETAPKTERCGNFGCEPVVFTEGLWELGNSYNLKFMNEEESVEITIPNYRNCFNEEYILPAFSYGNENLGWDNIIVFNPCDTNNAIEVKDYYLITKEKTNENLDDYLNDISLIRDDYDNIDPSSVEQINYNGQNIIHYISGGMIVRKCFFILGDEYQYNICYLRGNDDNEADTSMLDNIKILK